MDGSVGCGNLFKMQNITDFDLLKLKIKIWKQYMYLRRYVQYKEKI